MPLPAVKSPPWERRSGWLRSNEVAAVFKQFFRVFPKKHNFLGDPQTQLESKRLRPIGFLGAFLG